MPKKRVTPWARLKSEVRSPVNTVAARVVRQRSVPDEGRRALDKLRYNLSKETDELKIISLEKSIKNIERQMQRADKKLVDDRALDQAMKEMERSKWERNNK
jgi:hypothetical protein